MSKDEDLSAVNLSVAGDKAVARHLLLFHAEVAAIVDDEPVQLLERAFIEEQLDTLPG